MTEYRCTKCKTIKRIDAFYKNASNSRGVSSKCKACLNAETLSREEISRAKREEGKRRQREGFVYGSEQRTFQIWCWYGDPWFYMWHLFNYWASIFLMKYKILTVSVLLYFIGLIVTIPMLVIAIILDFIRIV